MRPSSADPAEDEESSGGGVGVLGGTIFGTLDAIVGGVFAIGDFSCSAVGHSDIELPLIRK